MIKVHVNGEERQLAAGSTVSDLLQEMELDRDGIAVAMNTQVVPRSRHAETEIPADARIEVIRAVGGG